MATEIPAEVAAAVDLCATTRAEHRKYLIRTSTVSYEGAPLREFVESLGRKYGPAGDWSPELGRKVGFHAYLYLAIAEQHLGGLETLIENGIHGVALGPPARSVAEASGRAVWLLDNRLQTNGIGARQRIARLLLDQEENARIFKKISYDFEHPERAKSGELARGAAEAIRRPGMFYPSEIAVDPKSGTVTLCKQSLPGPSGFVRIAGEIFGDDPRETTGYYGYMSAMTHPTVFAFLEMLDGSTQDPEEERRIPYKVDPVVTLKVACNAVRSFYNAWRCWVAWTNTGSAEIQVVHEAHRKAARGQS